MCAYKQGHGPAAYDLGINADLRKNFTAVLEYQQAGTKFGDKRSAAALMFIFDPEEWNSRDKQEQTELKELNILPDPERKRRYHQIFQALDINPDFRLTRLNQVIPLPPADLPTWNGIQDAIERESDGPPSY